MVLPTKTIAAACTLLVAVGLAACGDEEPGVDEPAREGLALPLGDVDYNVFITRQLNPSITPDKAYYRGPPAPKGQTLYGVFVQACNNSEQPRQTASEFKIVDNQDNEFEPAELPEDNEFAYHSTRLNPDECVPEAGSVAQLGPTAGSMLMFQLPLDVTENRPLELEVEAGSPVEEGEPHKLTFELDI